MNPKIAVVIPCYRVSQHILDVVQGALAQAGRVICVDDGCPEFRRWSSEESSDSSEDTHLLA